MTNPHFLLLSRLALILLVSHTSIDSVFQISGMEQTSFLFQQASKVVLKFDFIFVLWACTDLCENISGGQPCWLNIILESFLV